MTYSISCVLIIPKTMQATANSLIEGYGFGPNNLSVKLNKTADSSEWFGCHIWCDQEFIDFIQAHQAVDFLNTMIVSTATAGAAKDNWSATLALNGMTLPPEIP